MSDADISPSRNPLSAKFIDLKLVEWLEIEFTMNHVDDLAAGIAALTREDQDLLLGWIRRIATTNTHLAHQFAIRALPHMQQMAEQGQLAMHMIDAWALHIMDAHDRGGARSAFEVVNNVGNFAQLRHEHAHGAKFEDIDTILVTFVRGLSGL